MAPAATSSSSRGDAAEQALVAVAFLPGGVDAGHRARRRGLAPLDVWRAAADIVRRPLPWRRRLRRPEGMAAPERHSPRPPPPRPVQTVVSVEFRVGGGGGARLPRLHGVERLGDNQTALAPGRCRRPLRRPLRLHSRGAMAPPPRQALKPPLHFRRERVH